MAGRKPGTPKTGGRVKGKLNNVTVELKELARQYTVEALEALVGVMRSDNDGAKVAASKEILDRGYGKPSQHVDAALAGNVVHEVIHKIIDGD